MCNGSNLSFDLNISKAKAADSVAESIDLAKGVVENIQPVLSQADPRENNLTLNLTSEGYLAKPLIAETEITQKPALRTAVASRRSVPAVSATSNNSNETAIATAHRFPYGYCTYYVSQRRFVPWSGNAITWLSGARSFGYATGSEPQAGAIIVTSEGGSTGHVGMVDAVSGDQITITEMNYAGWGKITTRTISATYGRIMGYIY